MANIVIVVPASSAIECVKELFTEDKSAELFEVPSLEEAKQAALQFAPCVILLSVFRTQDVASCTGFVSAMSKHIKAGTLKVMVVSLVKDEKLSVAFQKTRTEYIVEPIAERSLYFKITMLLKALTPKAAADAPAKKDHASQDPASLPPPEPSAKFKLEGSAEAENDLEQDVWLFRGAVPKKVKTDWHFSLEGPDDTDGDWVIEEDAVEGLRWRWKPHVDTPGGKVFAFSEGWKFWGNKPSFDPKTRKWNFVGPKPVLAFDHNGRRTAKVEPNADESDLKCAPDSAKAKRNLQKKEEIKEGLADSPKPKKPAISRRLAHSLKQKWKQDSKEGSARKRIFETDRAPAKKAESDDDLEPFRKEGRAEGLGLLLAVSDLMALPLPHEEFFAEFLRICMQHFRADGVQLKTLAGGQTGLESLVDLAKRGRLQDSDPQPEIAQDLLTNHVPWRGARQGRSLWFHPVLHPQSSAVIGLFVAQRRHRDFTQIDENTFAPISKVLGLYFSRN